MTLSPATTLHLLEAASPAIGGKEFFIDYVSHAGEGSYGPYPSAASAWEDILTHADQLGEEPFQSNGTTFMSENLTADVVKQPAHEIWGRRLVDPELDDVLETSFTGSLGTPGDFRRKRNRKRRTL